MRDVQKKRERLAVAKWQAVKRMVYVAGSVTLGALAIDQGPRAVGQMAEFFDDFSILFYAGPLAEITITNNIADESAPTPWFTEDWDYTSSSNMHSDPNGWLEYNGAGTEANEMTLGIDSMMPSGPPYKYFQTRAYNAVANNGYDLSFPDASTDSLREIWHEQWIWFSDDWTTDNPGPSQDDHKTMFWQTPTADGTTRMSLKFGVFGTNVQASVGTSQFAGIQACDRTYSGETGGVASIDLANDFWNEQWHRIRIHIQLDRTPGVDSTGAFYTNWSNDSIGLDNDSTIVWCDQIGSGVYGSGEYFTETSLGRNMNNPPPVADTFYIRWGPTRIYSSDPGWVFDTVGN